MTKARRDPSRKSILYFAYGSNMHSARISERASSSQLVTTGRLHGYKLVFHKRGQDGSAKCDAWQSADPDDIVYGVVYRLSEGDKERLDRIEGVNRGYDCSARVIETAHGNSEAFVYTAQNDYIDAALLPFDWYRDLVLAGARAHGFPPSYVERIAVIECVADPDAARATHHRRLLAAHKQ